MSLDYRAVKDALATQIEEYVDRELTVRPYRALPGTFPCLTMKVGTTTFETMSSGGFAKVLLDLVLTVNHADPDSAEIAMDDFMSVGSAFPSSIIDAVQSDRTLGGVVSTCKVLDPIPAADDVDGGYQQVIPLELMVKKVGAQ